MKACFQPFKDLFASSSVQSSQTVTLCCSEFFVISKFRLLNLLVKQYLWAIQSQSNAAVSVLMMAFDFDSPRNQTDLQAHVSSALAPIHPFIQKDFCLSWFVMVQSQLLTNTGRVWYIDTAALPVLWFNEWPCSLVTFGQMHLCYHGRKLTC